MQAVLEKPLGVDETQLAPAATETVADFLKATAETPPPLAAPKPPLNPVLTEAEYCLPSSFDYTIHAANGKPAWQTAAWAAGAYADPLKPVAIPAPQGDTPANALLKAAGGWCQGSGLIGVSGTGEPDVDMDFPSAGPTTPTEVADFLDYAAERIIRFGWVQGTEMYGEYVCSVGALRLRRNALIPRMGSERATLLSEQACSALTNYLYRHKGNQEGIIGWNDTSGRTKGEVVTAFRAAAAELRGVGAPRIRRALFA
jgi:hypothetical protein